MRYLILGLIAKWIYFYFLNRLGDLKWSKVAESANFFFDFELELSFSFIFLLAMLLINTLRISFDYHVPCYYIFSLC
jgi:hypothetical protein